ncbi:MAG: asparagine synthase (glutamine-hydrolyzing) [Candidatus Nanohaloarchaea archaeon]
MPDSMCGILGAFSDSVIAGEEMESALDLLKERGPDDEGYRDLVNGKDLGGEDTSVNDLETVNGVSSKKWFAARRLAVTGGDDSHMPMSYRGWSIVFEGEIYNYQQIRDELREKDRRFRTEGDTEVFLHAFEEWGIDCVKKFHGKWTAALYNKDKDRVYCLRDHFGTKPLYYMTQGENLYFSSKISPLLRLSDENPEENEEISYQYLKQAILDHSRQTFFRDVEQLRPGEYLVFQDGDMEVGEIGYRDPGPDEDLKHLITHDIRARIPETEWALTLSGGLDSSIAAKILSDDVSDVFSADIEDGLYEKRVYRDQLIENENLDSIEVDISLKDLIQEIPRTIEHQEEPTNMLPAQAQNILFRKISENGNKAVVTGSGADELFMGYGKFLAPALMDSYRQKGLKDTLNMLREYSGILNLSIVYQILSVILPFHPKKWLEENTSLLDDETLSPPENYESLDPHLPETLEEARDDHLNYDWYPAITRFTDKNAGAHGLEIREAFLSQELYTRLNEYNLLENFRNGKTKHLLRERFEDDLPRIISDRDDKVGFLGTDDRAFTEEAKSIFLDAFRSESFRSRELINSEKVIERLEDDQLRFEKAYRLYSYEIWKREFIDS